MIPAAPKNPTHRFAHRAMNTLFELVIADQDAEYARQASAAAFAEIERLEALLSRFRSGADVARINRLTPGNWERVSLDTFACLRIAARVWSETNGAFDVTIGPLQACWRDALGQPRDPSPGERAEAQERTGMDLLLLDEAAHAVSVAVAGMHVDLGGIGKGYAIDRVAGLLRDWGITRALIHGGGSTALAMEPPAGNEGWLVRLRDVTTQSPAICLRNQAASGSGLPDATAHIYDTGTGQPVTDQRAAWSIAPAAGLADALSTAFMVMSFDEVRAYCETHRDVGAMILDHGGKLATMGIAPISHLGDGQEASPHS